MNRNNRVQNVPAGNLAGINDPYGKKRPDLWFQVEELEQESYDEAKLRDEVQFHIVA